jgi:proline iminopeptidase
MPGDEMIREAVGSLTHAITVRSSSRDLWPWIIQMGADRGGWYSYDALDNGGRPSAEKILRKLQRPSVGTIFPALPGRRDGFVLLENEPMRWLVLGWPSPDGGMVVTWAFMLHEIDGHTTRLIVRARASDGYRFHRLPKAMGLLLARAVHFVMERKQLLEIARRAEGGRKAKSAR